MLPYYFETFEKKSNLIFLNFDKNCKLIYFDIIKLKYKICLYANIVIHTVSK